VERAQYETLLYVFELARSDTGMDLITSSSTASVPPPGPTDNNSRPIDSVCGLGHVGLAVQLPVE
jgi:hypothetical protein